MTASIRNAESRLRVSRRGFLKASGAGVAAAGIGAVPFAASRAAAQQGWDAEHDVVVVGSGGAGFAAAVTAHHLGSDVAILEKGAYAGGTTLVSGAGIWIPNNDQMIEEGYEDPREDALKYMARHSFPHLYNPDDEKLGLSDHDFEMISAYYDLGPEAMNLIEESGAQEWVMSAGFGPAYDLVQTDYQAHFEENKAPKGRAVMPLDNDGNQGNGGVLVGRYVAWAEEAGVPIMLNHRVDRVILNDAGEVIGVEVSVLDAGFATPEDNPDATPETKDTIAIRARKGVVFGSGGFARNEDMMRHFMPSPYYGGCSAPTNEGDLVRISSSVGAKLGNMHNVWRNEGIFEQAIASAGAYNCIWYYNGDSFLMVNKEGRRFVNEKRNYQDRPMAHSDWDANNATWKNLLSVLVYDERLATGWGGMFPLPEDSATAPYVISGNTLEELAANIEERVAGIDVVTRGMALADDFAANMLDEVARFNEFARSGEDLDFQRGEFPYDTDVPFGPTGDVPYPADDQANVAMYPLSDEGPYYAMLIAPSAVDTNGGPVINADAQIVTWDGEPVVGLYGAGNCVASPSVNAYWGAGQTLGSAHVFGYAAGKHAHNASETSV